MEAYDTARSLINAAHAADPVRTEDGAPAELIYAERMESWVQRLVTDAPMLLRLAARCQHLERWRTPRSTYPEGRAGYLTWRKFLYTQQADRARDLLLQAGVDSTQAQEVHAWVSKTGLKENAGTQALEDAAIFVFLESEIGAFVSQHGDYPREKFIDILRKSWRKLSPQAQSMAGQLQLPAEIAALVTEALAG